MPAIKQVLPKKTCSALSMSFLYIEFDFLKLTVDFFPLTKMLTFFDAMIYYKYRDGTT